MPWTPKQHRFFAMCATSPGKAKGKCPPQSQARKMMKEGVTHKRKKRVVPRKDSRGYY